MYTEMEIYGVLKENCRWLKQTPYFLGKFGNMELGGKIKGLFP